MKTIQELRNTIDFNVTECTSSIVYFNGSKIDFDIYLPTKGCNLQRAEVWTLEQKQELIYSILIGRHIPHCAIVNTFNDDNPMEDIFQIIDGKQRISTMLSFYNNRFTIELEDKNYFYYQLPKDYQQAISKFYFRYYLVNDNIGDKMSDQQKINWFRFINYAGTPQDKEHLNKFL